MKYVDPDGRLYKNRFEQIFVYQVLGEIGLLMYARSKFISVPFKNFRSGSVIGGVIAYDKETYKNPTLTYKSRNTFIHEIFHQVQYYKEIGAFPELVNEYVINEAVSKIGLNPTIEVEKSNSILLWKIRIIPGDIIIDYTYEYDKQNLGKYKTLDDLPYYESQAQFVGDYASLYFEERFGKGLLPTQKDQLKQMAIIMNNSGYENTEAVRWILNDM